jgi:hypothetical protein
MPGLHFFDIGFLAFAMTCGIVESVHGIDGVLKGYVRVRESGIPLINEFCLLDLY